MKECSDGDSDDDDRTVASDVNAPSDSENNIQFLGLPPSGLTGLWRWEEVISELAA